MNVEKMKIQTWFSNRFNTYQSSWTGSSYLELERHAMEFYQQWKELGHHVNDVVDTREQHTWLHFAAFKNLHHLIEKLVQDGANWNLKDQKGMTPFMFLLDLDRFSKWETIEKALQQGGEVSKNHDEKTMMSLLISSCSMRGCSEHLIRSVFELLLKNGCSFLDLDSEGNPVFCKIVSGYPEWLPMLIDLNFDFDQLLDDGIRISCLDYVKKFNGYEEIESYWQAKKEERLLMGIVNPSAPSVSKKSIL